MNKEQNQNNKNNEPNYRDDRMYDIPYSREEQSEMTQACFLDMLDVIKPVLDKHFKGKLLSPLMVNNMFVPLVMMAYKAQFDGLPSEVRTEVYTSAYQNFIKKFGNLVVRETHK